MTIHSLADLDKVTSKVWQKSICIEKVPYDVDFLLENQQNAMIAEIRNSYPKFNFSDDYFITSAFESLTNFCMLVDVRYAPYKCKELVVAEEHWTQKYDFPVTPPPPIISYYDEKGKVKTVHRTGWDDEKHCWFYGDLPPVEEKAIWDL